MQLTNVILSVRQTWTYTNKWKSYKKATMLNT